MDLQKALKFASEFVGKDPERPWMHGVAVWPMTDDEPGMVKITATDGRKLGMTWAHTEYHTLADHVILCPKALAAALKESVRYKSPIIDLGESVLVGDHDIRRISRDIPWPSNWWDSFPTGSPEMRSRMLFDPALLSDVLLALKRVSNDEPVDMQMFGDKKPVRVIDKDRLFHAWVMPYEQR